MFYFGAEFGAQYLVDMVQHTAHPTDTVSG